MFFFSKIKIIDINEIMFARLDKVFKAQSMLIKNFLQLVTICASFLQSSFFLIPIIYYLLRTSPVFLCRILSFVSSKFQQKYCQNTVSHVLWCFSYRFIFYCEHYSYSLKCVACSSDDFKKKHIKVIQFSIQVNYIVFL